MTNYPCYHCGLNFSGYVSNNNNTKPFVLYFHACLIGHRHQSFICFSLQLVINFVRPVYIIEPITIDWKVCSAHFQHPCECYWVRKPGEEIRIHNSTAEDTMNLSNSDMIRIKPNSLVELFKVWQVPLFPSLDNEIF